MKALTYIEHGKFALLDKPKPVILDSRDAIVTVVALYDEAQTCPCRICTART